MSGAKPILRKTSKTLKQIPEKAQSKQEQSLSNLLAACMSQMEVALTLQPDCVDSKDVSLSESLETHHQLCEALERTEEQHAKVAENGDVLLKNEVKNSYKNVLRCTRDSPAASVEIKQGCNDMGKVEQLFFDNFKAIIHTVLERGEEEDALLKVTPFQTPESEATLDDRIANVTKRIRRIDTKINQCKARIEELKIPKVLEVPLTEEESQSFLNTPQQISLQSELDHLTVQLEKLCLEYREEERDITVGTNVVEEEIDYTLRKFDESMEVLQAEMEEKEEELRRHEEEINSLDKVLAPLEEEYNEVVARRERADEMIREGQKKLEAQTKAALIAQSWWRGHCVRKAMKNKDKKGKGKKGKGKKK